MIHIPSTISACTPTITYIHTVHTYTLSKGKIHALRREWEIIENNRLIMTGAMGKQQNTIKSSYGIQFRNSCCKALEQHTDTHRQYYESSPVLELSSSRVTNTGLTGCESSPVEVVQQYFIFPLSLPLSLSLSPP